MSKFDLYDTITQQVVTMLEKGVAPWRSPILGRSSAGHPKNLQSGKKYRGVNVFLLAYIAYDRGYGSSCWMTFNQAKERGGNVRKGEKATMVVFFKQLEVEDKAKKELKTIPMLRFYNVFNADQVEGVPAPDAVPFTPQPFTPIEAAAQIAAGYQNAPVVTHGGTQAFYRPKLDTIQMPEPTRFTSAEEYYSTLFHEFAHSTGHSTRLDRKLDTDPRPFGSADYGAEELIAEMTSAFLNARAGIAPAVIENQAAYLQGWIKTIKGNPKMVITAATAAQKAADWILGEPAATEAVQAVEASTAG